MNWKRLEGSPSLHQEMAALTLDDGRWVSIRRSIANGNTYVLIDDVWHYVTLDDILTDYLDVIEGETQLPGIRKDGIN